MFVRFQEQRMSWKLKTDCTAAPTSPTASSVLVHLGSPVGSNWACSLELLAPRPNRWFIHWDNGLDNDKDNEIRTTVHDSPILLKFRCAHEKLSLNFKITDLVYRLQAIVILKTDHPCGPICILEVEMNFF